MAEQIRGLSASIKTLVAKDNQQAEDIIPKVDAGVESIKELIDNMNHMSDRVAAIAANSEEIAAQTANVQHMAQDLQESVEEI